MKIRPHALKFCVFSFVFYFSHVYHHSALLISCKWLPRFSFKISSWNSTGMFIHFLPLFWDEISIMALFLLFLFFHKEVLPIFQSPFTECKNIKKQWKYTHLHMGWYKKRCKKVICSWNSRDTGHISLSVRVFVFVIFVEAADIDIPRSRSSKNEMKLKGMRWAYSKGRFDPLNLIPSEEKIPNWGGDHRFRD